MKLAEGLVLRADAQKRIQQVKQRLARVARIQEGDTPAEDPQELLLQLESTATQLGQLIRRINATNSATHLDNGQTLTDALAERDILKIRNDIYRELAEAASVSQGRSTRSEVKFISTISVSEIQRKADALAQEHRILDARIQQINWQTELMD